VADPVVPHPDGELPLWYLAVCEVCKPRLPQPFRDEAERALWVGLHTKGTGHTVTLTTKRGRT
jgi:hypothetical protein